MSKIDPRDWTIRCKHCGTIFTYADMIRKHKARQKDAPPGMYYVKCPGCGVEDFLTQPGVFMTMKMMEIKRRQQERLKKRQ